MRNSEDINRNERAAADRSNRGGEHPRILRRKDQRNGDRPVAETTHPADRKRMRVRFQEIFIHPQDLAEAAG